MLIFLLSACSIGKQPEPTVTPTVTPAPADTVEPSPSTPLAILLMPADMDKTTSDLYQTEVYNLTIRQLAEANHLLLADVYSAEVGVDWVIDQDHCHPNDLGHRLIANRVFEAIVRNCSFTARQMPRGTLIGEFGSKYGNGPQIRALPDGKVK